MDETARDTRSKILTAAASMIGEDPTARLSVRAVAARAGVSTGSLRHFFPTQRELIDTVVEGLQTLDLPDDPMADLSREPAERLLGSLQLLLTSIGSGASARQNWTKLHDAYVAVPVGDDAAHTFLAMERLAVDRVERWLAVLGRDDLLRVGEPEEHARFLLTVVNGLALERALPGARARAPYEASSLRRAVAAVLKDASTSDTKLSQGLHGSASTSRPPG